ncbi:MAG: hypothetical protein ACKOXB_15215 [Flavobacteriales bacterium]
MKKSILISLGISSVLLFGWSCSKENLGPDLSTISGPVTVLSGFDKKAASVDFSKNEEQYFTAEFENETEWQITLKGNTSTAVKTIKGISKTIDASNSRWTGYADDAPSFQKETVTAQLTFKHTTDTFTTTLFTTGMVNHDAGSVLVTDFATLKSNTEWPRDWPPVSITNNVYTDNILADGGKFFYMSGTPWQNNPYVNYMTISAKYADEDYGTYFPLYPDANRVYFNIMVYGKGPSDTWLQINFSENGVNARGISIRPDWYGWKLLSYNYNDLIPDANVTGDAKPNKLTSVSFVLLSDQTAPYTNPVSVAFDHPVFTFNKPYQP